MRLRADLGTEDDFYRLKAHTVESSFIKEGGKQAGVSAVAKFPYQMWAAGEFHVDPLKGGVQRQDRAVQSFFGCLFVFLF